MSTARIVLHELRVHRRRRTVLDGCSAEVGPGITLLAGANGAGKSTLLAAVAGLLPSSSGTVVVGGSPVGRFGLSRAQGRCVGYLPQEPHLPAALTVGEAIEYGRWLRAGSRRDAAGGAPGRSATEVVEQLGLSSLLDRPIGELSGGMNRLAMLAVAASPAPAVLLLDEATAGVDVAHRSTFRSFLDSMRDSTAVLLSSHVAADIEHLADRVLVLANGRFVFDGEVAELAALGTEHAVDRESAHEAAIRALSAGAAS